MIDLLSTNPQCHTLTLAQARTRLDILMLDRKPAAFRFKDPVRLIVLKLPNIYIPCVPRKDWRDAAPVEPFEFEQKLRLALRQVVMP